MGDFNSNSSNIGNAARGLKIFSGRVPSEFKDWRKQNCLVLSINRRDVYTIMKWQPRPTTATGGSTATTGRSPAQQQEAYDRASHDLSAILFMVTQKPASLIVLKHEDATGTSSDGRNAWEELQDKYLKVTDETIRAKTAELAAITMKSGQDPDDYFSEAIIKRAEVEAMGEPMTDRRFKDIFVQGFSPEYESIKLMMYRDPTFDLAQVQTTMRHLYLDNLSRSNEAQGRIAGRYVVMSADSVVCYNCGKAGHISRNCPMPAKSDTGGHTRQDKGKKDSKNTPPGAKAGSGGGDGAGQKWCSVHNSTTHNDADCYQQRASRPQKGSAFTTAVVGTRTSLADDDEKPALNFNDDFNGGFLWMASTNGRTFLPNSCGMTILVDSVTEHFLDDELIPGLKDRMKDYALPDVPKTTVAAGNRELRGDCN